MCLQQPNLISSQTFDHKPVWMVSWWWNSSGYPDTEAASFLPHHVLKRSLCLNQPSVSAAQMLLFAFSCCLEANANQHCEIEYLHTHTHKGKGGAGLCLVSAHTSHCFLQTCETRRAAFHRVESLKSCSVSVLKTNSKQTAHQSDCCANNSCCSTSDVLKLQRFPAL